MIAEFLVLLAFPVSLALAAGWDLASYTIPNPIQIALLVTFLVFVPVSGMTSAALGAHVLAGAIGLIAGFTLFGFGIIGGGDAKLFACVALMLGLHDLLDYTLVASLMGGGLTVALLAMRQTPLPRPFASQAWIARLHDAGAGVPYGVALAGSAFVLLPHTEIFRLAAAG